MLDRIRKWNILLFSAVFALIWFWLLITVTAAFQESKKISLAAAVCLVMFVLGSWAVRRYFRQFQRKRLFWQGWSAVVFFMMTVGLLYAGLGLRV